LKCAEIQGSVVLVNVLEKTDAVKLAVWTVRMDLGPGFAVEVPCG
jgi:hypothetical protein